MIKINTGVGAGQLVRGIERLWDLSAAKIRALERRWPGSDGAPVYTVGGKYTSRSWTEWTEGFRYGSAILQFDATGDPEFLEIGRQGALDHMASHLTHFGVHDHGFNNVSTYGNLLRLMREGRIPRNTWERNFYELALRCSGAVQARRWTSTSDGGGFIYSFNGPHSLFADTIRSLRSLAIAHQFGQVLLSENDRAESLLSRLADHARATAAFSVYYGRGRDAFDVRGRVAHESIFSVNDGSFRCPGSQQGYSPFTTWTRGLAWAMLGFAEQLEFVSTLSARELAEAGGKAGLERVMLDAAMAVCDFYIANTPADGIPYWDTGAPGLAKMGDYLSRPADPFNEHEPVDSSAATIAAQGLLRLGRHLGAKGSRKAGRRYWQAGLTVLAALLDEPYLCASPRHQGLILHSVYHRPNGWDHVPRGRNVPCGESGMWGDYHAREAAAYLRRIIRNEPYHTFFGP